MNAEGIMTSNVVTASPTDSVKKVIQLLIEKKVSGVPVVDDQKRVLGVVTEYDLILAIATVGAGQDIQQIMKKKFSSLLTKTDVEDITDLILTKRFKSFPVIDDDGKLVGVVSRRDVMGELYTKG